MSSWITLEEARTNLKMWLEEERAVSTGQSYRIGTHSLTRASLSDIAKRIEYWRNEIAKLESGQGGRMRSFRVTPVDF